ncbi:MAG: CBS domain-containing protein [Planctomycetota bacterium]|nr:MAG: CBS domain-containing protein [Planctomycetota bacterium]
MPTAADALARKAHRATHPDDLVVVSPDATVLEAAKVMNARRIGALPVVNAQGTLVGMFTERDVLTRVVAVEKPPQQTLVRDVMTTPVFACPPQTPLTEVRQVMREKRIRHVPIVDDGRLLGLLSIGDLNAEDARQMTQTITYLEQYMYTA